MNFSEVTQPRSVAMLEAPSLKASLGIYFCNSCGRTLSPEEVVLCCCGVVNCDSCLVERNGLLVCKVCVER